MSHYSWKKKYPKYSGGFSLTSGYGGFMMLVIAIILFMALIGRIGLWIESVAR